MEKLIIEVPDDKIQLVKKLLNAVGVKHSNYQKGENNKDALTNISVWTDKDIEAFERVNLVSSTE